MKCIILGREKYDHCIAIQSDEIEIWSMCLSVFDASKILSESQYNNRMKDND